MMRNISRYLLVALFSLAMAACGGGGGGGGSDSGTASTSSGTSSSTSSGSSSTGSTSGGSSTPTTPTTPTTTQTVQLSWTPPATRADGSALQISELTGYRLYIVADADASQDTTMSISGGTTTTAQVALTAPGSYTFAITAVDVNGLESSLSNQVPLTLN